MHRLASRWLRVTLVAFAVGVTCGCQRQAEKSSGAEATADSEEVLLRGRFQRVAKPAAGEVELIRRGNKYLLRLKGARVEQQGEVKVYFVGLPETPSTIALVEARTKYDFGPLEQGAPEQLIELPSEPAQELRSVVLYEPRYGINLAAAALAPQS